MIFPETRGALTIGVDIGQKRDPTAICISEATQRTVDGRVEEHCLIRHLNRVPLGTPYPAVARKLADLSEGVQERARSTVTLFVDATGVGKPVVDLLTERLRGVQTVPVYFTHGDRRTERREEGRRSITVGKAWLTSRLQAMLQAGRLHLPRTPEAEALSQELLDFEIRVDPNGNDKYGAFRVGSHDDLVTALGLAIQGDTLPPPDIF